MKSALSFLVLAATALASPAPQGVTSAIAPSASPSAGCQSSYDGQFQVTVIKPLAKRDLIKRQSTCGKEGVLTVSLANSQLLDAQGRTGYIAANYQFQFDKPAQTGAIYTSGFSVCTNSSATRGDSSVKLLALGGTTTFYQCLSGSFYNLYDRSWAPQCSEVAIQVLPCSGSSSSAGVSSTSAPATASVAPGVTTSTIATGTPSPATVISDGQPQGSSAVPVTPPKVTVISDGQPQAPSAIPLAQLSDGQPNMPTALVSQLGDGQPIATTTAAAGAANPTGAVPISQITDGQPQAGNATVVATPTITPFQGGAAVQTAVANFAAVAAGAIAIAML